MAILGIDPGTRITGYAVLDVLDSNEGKILDFGCIRPPRDLKLSEKYLYIYEGINTLLHSFSISAVAFESQYMDKNPQSTLKLGMAKGAALLAATKKGISSYEYSPSEVKRALTGSGKASKHQMQKMLQFLLKLSKIPNQDAADAVATAVCHHHMMKNQLKVLAPL